MMTNTTRLIWLKRVTPTHPQMPNATDTRNFPVVSMPGGPTSTSAVKITMLTRGRAIASQTMPLLQLYKNHAENKKQRQSQNIMRQEELIRRENKNPKIFY